ncbi:hypothetical protein AaE_012550 [Aphanomyces astaci]|uniref:Integrase catalytic domain-containing protein n=1 Tax=Aphanomyces astaci TaxID=112090 RepID=A0A6A4ZFJ1_APHAT|nr:hypothetical protein AaE_012550 [Aphanomyces astaci]
MTPQLFHPIALLASWRTPKLSRASLARLWQRLLGHPGVDAFNQMTNTNPELMFLKSKHLRGQLCETCAYAKSKRSPFDSSAMSIFKHDVSELRHSSPMDIGTLQSDNPKEYEKLGHIIKPKYNTQVAFSNAYSPQQNAVAERRLGIVVQKMRAMLIEGALPKFLWALALDYASWLINISPSASNKGVSPYHVVVKRHSSLGHIKTFGCTAFVHIQRAIIQARPPCRQGHVCDSPT